MDKDRFKFIAWDKEERKMIEWSNDFFCDYSPVTKYSGEWNYIDMPLMQWTGFIDNDGKDIYEGYILNFNHSSGDEFSWSDGYYVKMYNGSFSLVGIDSGYVENLFNHYIESTGKVNLYIVGNIYEDMNECDKCGEHCQSMYCSIECCG